MAILRARDGVTQYVSAHYYGAGNDRYNRSGTLLEGRYKSSVIRDDAHLLICMRYIELNPVRAGMVQHPADYPWSSYHANALVRMDKIITPHALYLALATKEAYRDLFAMPFSEKDLRAIR